MVQQYPTFYQKKNPIPQILVRVFNIFIHVTSNRISATLRLCILLMSTDLKCQKGETRNFSNNLAETNRNLNYMSMVT